MEPYPKNLRINDFRVESPIPMTLERLADDPYIVSEDQDQCNTIVHEPNSRCLTSKIESQTTSTTSALPISYPSKVPSPLPDWIKGRTMLFKRRKTKDS